MNIGDIEANTIGTEHNRRDAIRCGNITGNGLLGEILTATNELVAAACEVVYHGSRVPIQVRLRHERAWLGWYDSLKAIEEIAE